MNIFKKSSTVITLIAALTFGAPAPVLVGVATTGFIAVSVQPAEAKKKCAVVTVCDPVVAAPGNKYKGNKVVPLKYWVLVCHPDFAQLNAPKWWSFAFISNENKLGALISSVLRTGMAPEEIEVDGAECIKHNYEPGRVLVVVDPCLIPGKNVFLVTKPLRPQDNGTKAVFFDYPELRKYAF